MSVLGIKLVTGQEIFGSVEITPEGRFKINEPVTLRMVPSNIQGGQPNMAIVPWPEFSDPEVTDHVKIEPLHVVYTYTPHSDFVEEYKNAISGIAQQPKTIITG